MQIFFKSCSSYQGVEECSSLFYICVDMLIEGYAFLISLKGKGSTVSTEFDTFWYGLRCCRVIGNKVIRQDCNWDGNRNCLKNSFI